MAPLVKQNPQIIVNNLSYSYSSNSNSNSILKNVSFEVFEGDFVAIMGPNGVGKSTLIKILTNLISIKQRQKHITIKGKVAYIPQKFNQDPQFPISVKELLALECCKCSHRNQILKSLRIQSLENKQFRDLSGGQQQRVFVALSLLSNPDILVLDEPTIGVDSNTQEEFYKLLHKLNVEQNLTILLVTHDTSMVSEYVSKVLCVGNKTIIEDSIENANKHINETYPQSFYAMHNHH